MPKYKVSIANGLKAGEHFEFDNEPCTIGRIQDNDIVLENDDIVSRHHAKIVLEDDKLILVDLESKNGTKVNGKKISRQELKSHDKIEVGGVSLAFEVIPEQVNSSEEAGATIIGEEMPEQDEKTEYFAIKPVPEKKKEPEEKIPVAKKAPAEPNISQKVKESKEKILSSIKNPTRGKKNITKIILIVAVISGLIYMFLPERKSLEKAQEELSAEKPRIAEKIDRGISEPVGNLRDKAKEAFKYGEALYNERMISYENTYKAIEAYKKSLAYQRHLDPKPDYFHQTLLNLKGAKEYLDSEYRIHKFEAEKAIRVKDWKQVKKELKICMILISDRKDERYKKALKRLKQVEKHLAKQSAESRK
ncbi:FHA domain-containing protein [bacterium]|nr:FHA domain-containing protein [bacterium]